MIVFISEISYCCIFTYFSPIGTVGSHATGSSYVGSRHIALRYGN